VPSVSLDININASVDRVWDAVLDIERYSDSMANVRWVKILERDGATIRRSAWSIILKGSILEWQEEDRLDPEARTVRFHQLSGDLAEFDGEWSLKELGPELTKVTFDVSFEIGIPLLAEMLNPVAQRSLRENCKEMLAGVEREALAA
jgi:ribosome-associated toxin RatA of RatAB toxin-antitoxin module